MGSREIGLFLALFFCLHTIAASLLDNNFPSGHLEDATPVSKKIPTYGTSDFSGDSNDKNKIFHSRKFAHGGGVGGGEGGRSAGSAESGSQSGDGQGGRTVIPIRGAAANNHHPKGHHGIGSRNPIPVGLSVIAAFFALVIILER